HELKMVVRGCELEVAPPAMGDALLPMALIAAMSRGLTLEVADQVSPKLLENMVQFQLIIHMWYPYLEVVEVKAPVFDGEAGATLVSSGKRAQFFSGGVDSLHLAYEDAASLDALVFVGGTDTLHWPAELRRETVERLSKTAARLDLPLIDVESNFREWATACGRHSDDFLSARLAAISHLLGERFEQWVIAPSILDRPVPFWSSALTDPRWSSGRVLVSHPVPARNRAEKIWDLAQEDGLLEDLRICMQGAEYNCGTCRKCMRTLLTLKMLGMADRAPVFAQTPETLEILDQLSAAEGLALRSECFHLRENIDVGRAQDVEAGLITEMEERLHGMQGRMEWGQVEAMGEEAFLQSHWDHVPFEARRSCFRKLLALNPEWLVKELATDLPAQKEAVFAAMWKSERSWLRKTVGKASLKRLVGKLHLGRRKPNR
ncbi:MAG: hypothetical protein ACR2RV_16050, partial [Verrucomicrobiales bacterium]